MIKLLMALVLSAPGISQEIPGELTLGQWRELPPREQKMAVLAAVEGLILAGSSPSGTPGINQECVARIAFDGLDKIFENKEGENRLFVDALVEGAGCKTI